MRRNAKWISALSLALMVGMAQAQNVTGAWKGSLDLDMSKMPKQQDAAKQKQMMDAIAAMTKGIKFGLTLNANKTFKMVVTGMPAMGGQPGAKGGEPQTAEGTWTQKGSVVTIKITKANGSAPKGQNPPQDLKVMDNGKKLILEPGQGRPMGGKILFIR